MMRRDCGNSSAPKLSTGACVARRSLTMLHLATILVVPAFGSAGVLRAQPGPLVPCDVDEDGDVDLDDYAAFDACHTGPSVTHDGTQSCAFADGNSDGHVDAADFKDLQVCFSGAGNPADGGCAVRPIAVEFAGGCGGNPPSPTMAAGPDMHKVTINAPDAVCNDGSPGVFYIRRAENGNLDRWVFFIQGGGGCGDFENCMRRWCGLHPVYTAAKMSTLWAHDSIAGQGIFNRAESPLAAANLVYFYYCSSDSWTGTRSNAVLSSEVDPDQTYSLHFRGHRILEAALDMLLAGGVTSDNGEETVPPLSTATEILFTGTSAGANGARDHVDWFAAQFDPSQTTVRAVFDAAFPPSTEAFDDPAIVAAIDASAEAGAVLRAELYHAFWDESCVQTLGGTDDWWRCASGTYVGLNHVTTPFFQRMDITDPLPSGAMMDAFGVPLDVFAAATIDSLAMLPDIGTNAAEAGQIDYVPGVYGPNCSQHVALTTNSYFLMSTVDDDSGIPRTFDEALRARLAGTDVFVVDQHPAASSTCP